MDTFECVLVLAEYRNMTKAADQLYLTQPAFSLRIQRLEKELGIQIFDRSTRPISITPEGQAYIQGMTRIRNEEEKLKYKLNEIKGKSGHTFRVGIGFNRGRYWLPELMPLLQHKYPEFDYQFQEATDQESEKLLKSADLDFGITGSFSIVDGLTSIELGQEDIFVGIPPNNEILKETGNLSQYTIQNPFKIDIKALNGQTIILGRTSYGLTRHMNMLFSMSNVTPGRIINIGNGETSYQLAAKGIGITFMFSSYHVSPIEDETLRPVPCILRDFPLRRNVYLICSLARADSEQTRNLVDSIKQLFYCDHRAVFKKT